MAMVERTAQVAAPAALALFAAIGVVMTQQPAALAVTAAAVAIVVAALLAWRRLGGWPVVAGLALPVAVLAFLGHEQSANLAWMGMCVVAAWATLTSATSVGVSVGALLASVPLVEWLLDTTEPGWAAWFTGIAFTTIACSFARRLRITVAELREAQEELAERTRAKERSRIAGEVHDVLGHALTVSLLHIGGARLALDEEPEEARCALAEAERLTRASLEEVRATVGLMRTDAPDRVAPLPGAADLPELVESFTRAGSRIDLAVDGDPSRLGPTRGLAAYRIVQEALTNATRHAAGEPVQVYIRTDAHSTVVTVCNGGTPDPSVAPGSGLLGMQERAENVGGRLTAGPTFDGWQVEAVLPS